MQGKQEIDKSTRDLIRTLFVLFYDYEIHPEDAAAKVALAIREASACLLPTNGNPDWNTSVEFLRRRWIRDFMNALIEDMA